MLLAIKQYCIKKKAPVTLAELVLHFKQPPDVMCAMLQHWLRKGNLCRLAEPSGCGLRCQQCGPVAAEVYQWSENSYTV